MKTFCSRTIKAFIACLGGLTVVQSQVTAQWVESGKLDYYPSEPERLRALDQTLKLLEKADPIIDLRASVQKNDLRLVGFMGVGLVVPAIPIKTVRLLGKRGFKVLRGSNDVVYADTYDRQEKVVEKYMKPYNRALLKYLIAQNKKRK